MNKVILALALASSPAMAGGITDRLALPADGTFTSTKVVADLELCAADAVGDIGFIPVVIHDAGRVHVVGWKDGDIGRHLFMIVRLRPSPSGSTVETRAVSRLNSLNEHVRAYL